MDTNDMIDLGKEYDSSMPCSPAETSKDGKKTVSYPSLYISGIEDIPDLPDGDFYITAKVSVCRMTVDKKNDDNSIELDVKAMKVVGEAPSEGDTSMYEEMKKLAEEGSAGALAEKMAMDDEED